MAFRTGRAEWSPEAHRWHQVRDRRAKRSGVVTRLVAREFENFLPIAASDAAFLHDSLQRSWQVGGNPPARLGFARGALLLDGVAYDLAANLPFEPRCTRDRIVLRGAGGEIVAQRVTLPRARPVIWIQPLGNIVNRALQYLTAAGIRDTCRRPRSKTRSWTCGGIDTAAPRPAGRPQCRRGPVGASPST